MPTIQAEATPLDHELVPFEGTRVGCLMEVGDIIRTRDVIVLQSNVVCNWLVNHQTAKGITMKQEVSIGRFFRKTLRASLTVKTW